MLTIGQLASYTGVTVRAVRHYHQIGLLAEPGRDASGYRSYGATDVVRLIKIRTLAEAGVPLSRVAELLEADEATFAKAVEFILGLIRESLTVDLEIPEPVEEVYSPSPEVSARLSEMEPI